MEELIIRPYQSGDERAILALTESIYGEVVDKESWFRWWNWRYRDCPAGFPIIWLADCGDKIVGQYLIELVSMKIHGEIIMGAHSESTMTHPDFRRQGIFEKLAKKTYETAKERKVSLVYGFPNKYSHDGFINKLGWIDVCLMQTLIRPLIYGAGRPHDNFDIGEFELFDDSMDGEGINKYRVLVVKDKDYLNWRYINIPCLKHTIIGARWQGKVVGYVVTVRQGLKGYIVDLTASDDDVARCLIFNAISQLRKEGANFAIYRVSNEIYGKAFAFNGFAKFRLAGKVPLIARSNMPDKVPFLKNPHNWFVQAGDSDTL